MQGSEEHGMLFARAGKSAVVRVAVKPISVQESFEAAEPAVRDALSAAKLLLDWYRRVVLRQGAT
jgi:hypothetical protein